MEIRDEHMRWAVVHRLGNMLERVDALDPDHSVTLSYSLMLSIVCWGRQRLGGYHPSKWPPALYRLLTTPVIGVPWGIPINAVHGEIEHYPGGVKADTDNEPPLVPITSATAYEFLVFLRNSTAHGDERNVSPICESERPDCAEKVLVGFEIRAGRTRRGPQVTGVARLRKEHLVHFGTTAARLFADAYCLGPDDQRDAQQAISEDRKVARLRG